MTICLFVASDIEVMVAVYSLLYVVLVIDVEALLVGQSSSLVHELSHCGRAFDDNVNHLLFYKPFYIQALDIGMALHLYCFHLHPNIHDQRILLLLSSDIEDRLYFYTSLDS